MPVVLYKSNTQDNKPHKKPTLAFSILGFAIRQANEPIIGIRFIAKIEY